MDKTKVLEALKKAKEQSKKRNFSQRYDIIVNLKDINLKDPTNQLDLFVNLHYPHGKKMKVCALVGSELKEEAEKVCDKTIHEQDFANYAKDKKATKKVAEEFDYFIAQANIMGKVAGAFGRTLGPRKKMPNPKAGCVVPPKTSLQPICERLQHVTRVYAKERPIIQCTVGIESMKDEEVVDNIQTVFKQILSHVPNEKNNIKSVYLKTTMGKPVKLM
ncbi:50S ribosomal protein L1 [Candidatus Woesearchaeota archaeon]|jgi:large subunit ribosomal protein L1|nr:50S ribosomal protein L1 [Candidatus Woesearchaeota archaeon]MBT3538310.1 50S ribosomal protein L1 [Candidatus Woesearchaeota archaeon]MBT4696696.1 50S ribosomal protein L1 [Candidatus Woesearchaeota archaeon]MBT4716814.1 50S ribosomal protein L1 [Candidatus Woesearchaeota archaeon]MBT7105979.1 50S ribosomal protein L1 [Candidatus Woesearchaeota archaeon]